MNRLLFKRLGAALLCLCLLTGLTAAAAEGVAMTASIGYDGVVTYLRTLPIKVRLENKGGDVTGELAVTIDRDEISFDQYTLPLSIAAGATVDAVLPVSLSTRQNGYTLTWLENGEAVRQIAMKPSKVLAPSTLMVGLLSDQPQNLQYFTINQNADALKRGEYWQAVPLDAASFPADADGMAFFDILVVDGVDVGTLSDQQRQALDGWLKNGGVVILGGGPQAAAAFPYFSAYSGITAGALTPSDTLSQSLLKLFKLSNDPLDAAVSVVSLKGASGAAVGDEPLVDLCKVENGCLLTASFSLSDKPLNSWLGNNAIWQRILLDAAQTRYMAMVNERLNGYQRNSRYAETDVLTNIPIPSRNGMATPMIILAVFVALVGFGAYFLLKKLDKREWMWAVSPLLCGLCVLAIWGASQTLRLQQPMMTSYTVLTIGQDGVQSSYTGACTASASTGRQRVTLAEGSVDLSQSSNYYYEQSETTAARKLRYETLLGDSPAVVFPESVTWSDNSFMVNHVPLRDCHISGSAGWEGKKLVFTVENTGALPLSDGLIITDYGYATVPALLPGQRVTAALTPDDQTVSYNDDIKDGMLLDDAERRNFSFYDFINAYRVQLKAAGTADNLNARVALLQNYANNSDWYNNVGDPYYIAFSDELADLNLSLNGEAVTRKGQLDMVATALRFDPVSADGDVRFLNGYIPVLPAETDSRGKPSASPSAAQGSNGNTSYRLADEPAFAFDLSKAPESWTMANMDISPRYAYFGYQIELYRVTDGQWVLFKTHEYDQNTGKENDELELPALDDFLNDDHWLFARFTAYGKTEEYADITQPELTMDGRLN